MMGGTSAVFLDDGRCYKSGCLEYRLLIVQTLLVIVTVSFGVLGMLMSRRSVYYSRAATSASVTS